MNLGPDQQVGHWTQERIDTEADPFSRQTRDRRAELNKEANNSVPFAVDQVSMQMRRPRVALSLKNALDWKPS